MASRTALVCLCEGKTDSIDSVFINSLVKSLDPNWLRPWSGSNRVRLEPCGGRTAVIERLPGELRSCLRAGGKTTLMVWADCDHDCPAPDDLRALFWAEAQQQGISQAEFDTVVFALARDRIENWIEFLQTGATDESKEGPRLKHTRPAADAAKKLARFCSGGEPATNLPDSLQWSCANWRELAKRMA